MNNQETMMCAQFKVNYVGKQSRIIKALFVDLADMEIEISKFSKMPGVESIDLQDYKTVQVRGKE